MISASRIRAKKSRSDIIYRHEIKGTTTTIRNSFEKVVSEVIDFYDERMTPSQKSRLMFFSLSTIYASVATLDMYSTSAPRPPFAPRDLQAIGEQVSGALPSVLDPMIMKASAVVASLNLLHQISLVMPDVELEFVFDLHSDRYTIQVGSFGPDSRLKKKSFESAESLLVYIVETFCS